VTEARTCNEDTHACAFSRETSSVNLSISSLQGMRSCDASERRTRQRSAQVARFHGLLYAKHACVIGKLRLRLDEVQTRFGAIEVSVHLQDVVTEVRAAASAVDAPALCALRSPCSRTPTILSRNCNAASLTVHRSKYPQNIVPLAQLVRFVLLLKLSVKVAQLLDQLFVPLSHALDFG
jgi:hypothetical protein